MDAAPAPHDRLVARAVRVTLPAWLLSLLLHGGTLLVLAVSLRFSVPGPGAEPDRDVGIVLKQLDEQSQESFVGEDDLPAAESAAPSDHPLSELLQQPAPSNPAELLPKPQEWIGVSAAAAAGAPSTGEMTAGPRSRGRPSGHRTRTQVFGTAGEGSKFVYVFDRSGSMGGSGRTALDAAKVELLSSLEALDRQHLFQIIFYNDEPSLFTVDGRAGKLAFGDDETKQQAARFVKSILADGATEHERALQTALKLQPDVIFFLTDADQPILSETQLARIARANAGRCQINTIEFGLGPALDIDNFLMKLARQNGGQHVYVDITRLGVDR